MSNIATLRLLDLTHIYEVSFDPIKPDRICSAEFVLNSGEETDQYVIRLSSDKRLLVLIQPQ